MKAANTDAHSVEHLPKTLIAGYVVFNANGRPQFAWKDRQNGCFYAESDGKRLNDIVAATTWFSDIRH